LDPLIEADKSFPLASLSLIVLKDLLVRYRNFLQNDGSSRNCNLGEQFPEPHQGSGKGSRPLHQSSFPDPDGLALLERPDRLGGDRGVGKKSSQPIHRLGTFRQEHENSLFRKTVPKRFFSPFGQGKEGLPTVDPFVKDGFGLEPFNPHLDLGRLKSGYLFEFCLGNECGTVG
jgi:hypothetical protein